MTWRTFSTSTANWIAVRQLRSACTTTLATLRWTNISPGRSPTIWFAGTRLSEQPIQRDSGACWCDRRAKNSGSWRAMSAAQRRVFVANKSDGNQCEKIDMEGYALSLGQPIQISAEH